MRIALVSPYDWSVPGGVNRHVSSLALNFLRKGHEPEIIAPSSKPLAPGTHHVRVIGESVRCPFHAWRYDGDTGACVEIPYCKRIPERARVRAWDVVERNHMIFVWHHAEQKPPSWEVPVISQLDDPDWSPMRTFELEVPVHMQDMAENNLDAVHFQVVHSAKSIPPTKISYAEDGRLMHATSHSEQETPLGTFELALIRDTWCLGMSSVESSGIPGVGLYLFSSTAPVDRENTISRWALTATFPAAGRFVSLARLSTFTALGYRDDHRTRHQSVHLAHRKLADRQLVSLQLEEPAGLLDRFLTPSTQELVKFILRVVHHSP